MCLLFAPVLFVLLLFRFGFTIVKEDDYKILTKPPAGIFWSMNQSFSIIWVWKMLISSKVPKYFNQNLA